MKTEFELEYGSGYPASATAKIIIGEGKPHLRIYDENGSAPLFLKDKDLERFAVNILKAIKSKKSK